jgi:hypothetical protein
VRRPAWPWRLGSSSGAASPFTYAGTTSTAGPPTTGTYATSTWVKDLTGTPWICTAGGSPGAWAELSGALMLPLPSGTPVAGDVPTASGTGEGSVWAAPAATGLALPSGTAAAGTVPLATGTGTATQWLATAPGTIYLDQFTGTDDQKMTSALAAWATAGGGTIQLAARAHVFTGQWATSYTAGVALGLKVQGAGVAYNGQWGLPAALTTCDMQYSGAGAARIDIQHLGSVEICGIMFEDTAGSTVPFFQTTNATPELHHNVFAGNASVSGQSCYQDAIVLGGAGSGYGSGDTAAYQGYQGSVHHNFFHRIRRIALFQMSANSIEVHENTISTSCGNGAYLGGCIEFDNTANNCTGNHIWGNCVEMVYYPCFIRCTAGATLNTFGPNGLYDATTALTLAYYAFLSGSTVYNDVIDGFSSGSVPLMLDLSGYSVGVNNQATTFRQSGYSLYPQPIAYFSGSYPPMYMGAGGGAINCDPSGNGAQLQAGNDVPSADDSYVQLYAYSCTQVTDGIVYTGSPVVVSHTAAFTTTDVPRPIHYTGSGSYAIIIRSITPSTAFPWVASNAYNLGDVARPTAGNSHLYQCTTAGTSGSAQPTWPTGGGTVTDGTAVWTDLGTTATAVLASVPSSATATGVTVSFGRQQTGVPFTKFDRHHIITTDGGTPSTAADTGAGSGAGSITTTGSDHSFTVNITSGTGPASGQMFHSVIAQNSGTLRFMMTAGNSAAASLMAGGYWVTLSGTSVLVNFVNAPAASTAYVFNFVSLG